MRDSWIGFFFDRDSLFIGRLEGSSYRLAGEGQKDSRRDPRLGIEVSESAIMDCLIGRNSRAVSNNRMVIAGSGLAIKTYEGKHPLQRQ